MQQHLKHSIWNAWVANLMTSSKLGDSKGTSASVPTGSGSVLKNGAVQYQVAFVLGGPGSGKGTQSAKLVEEFGVVHMSAGDLLRAHMKSGSPEGQMVAEMIANGQIVPSSVTVSLLQSAMDVSGKFQFLIDGFPRNEENRAAFEEQTGIEPKFVLFFDCPEEVMEQRLLGRNEGRTDDNIETIRKRFRVFIEQSMPVVQHYEATGRVARINADRPAEEVYKEELLNNLRAFVVTAAGSAAHVAFCGLVGRLGLLPKRLSRKLMHIGAGGFFALCWPLYAAVPWSPYLAASVPLLASIQFALVGTGFLPDVLGLVPGATRSGSRTELLRGPFLYGVVHSLIAVLAWRRPSGIMAIAVLCGGDGMAEVVGAGVASASLPWNPRKTIAGSIACFVGGCIMGVALLRYFVLRQALLPAGLATTSLLSHNLSSRVAACAIVGALAESIPLPGEGLDNVIVPIAAGVASLLAFGA